MFYKVNESKVCKQEEEYFELVGESRKKRRNEVDDRMKLDCRMGKTSSTL